jgi:hypothetical protein
MLRAVVGLAVTIGIAFYFVVGGWVHMLEGSVSGANLGTVEQIVSRQIMFGAPVTVSSVQASIGPMVTVTSGMSSSWTTISLAPVAGGVALASDESGRCVTAIVTATGVQPGGALPAGECTAIMLAS